MQALFLLGVGNDDEKPPPWRPDGKRFEGPWLQQQLILSASIGLISFLIFSLVRRKSPALFAPRTKLKGFTPHASGFDDGVFSWIGPTLRTDDLKILHIVGLDAAILLAFFKMAFWIFLWLSLWSCAIVMPVNYKNHGSIDGVAPSEEPKQPDGGDGDDEDGSKLFSQAPWGIPWTWTLPSTTPYHVVHLLSTYLFSFIILRALHKGFHKFVRSRQLYALDLLQSIPARTVEVRNLPTHLQKERALAEYFEGFGLKVESTAVVGEVAGLKELLAKRATALYELERMWCKWLGNPTKANNYDPEKVLNVVEQRAPLIVRSGRDSRSSEDVEAEPLLGASTQNRGLDLDPTTGIVAPENKRRPTVRLQSWNPFSKQVDAIEWLERRFRVLDRDVKRVRAKGAPPSSVGFVTFVNAMSAQIAAQTVHYPLPVYCKTNLAPEPRDIIWSNVALTSNERRVRQVLVSAFTFALFVFYVPPLAFLASFLSPGTIKKYLPSLYDLLKKDERLMAIASTSLPSIVVIGFNALLPLILEWTALLQGLKARSLVEFSVLKRYHIFLVTSVIFVFLITRTALGVLADLAGNPMRIIDKLAESLPGARSFSLSYVVFQALAVVPLQLLQLPVVVGRSLGRLFSARTPREHAELNAPPQLYAGSVYPSALIVFTLCIVYSIVSPLVTIFGALYFGLAYVVYKHKLLFVFYKSYESRGQAWPLSTFRCIWALCLFQFFQLSLFSVRKQLLLSTLTLPLIIFTLWFGRLLDRTFTPLSENVNLSSIAEVDGHLSQADGSVQVQPSNDARTGVSNGSTNPLLAFRADTVVDPSQTALSRKKYAAKDETLFVAQRDKHTDYREPPMGGYFFGTLNTGRRRYGHPALTGLLPELWLPIPIEEDDGNEVGEELGEENVEPLQVQTASNDSATLTPSASHLTTSGPNATSGSSVTSMTPSRLRKSSRPNEALVISLRKRKESLLRKSTLSTSTSVATGAAPSNHPNISTDSIVSPSTEGLPPHVARQRDKARMWDEGPQGSSHQAAIGELLTGNEAVTPTRRVDAEMRGSRPRVLQGEMHEGRVIDEEDRVDEGRSDEEEEEDEEEEGVYMHRTARDQLPGSFPGFDDPDD